MKKFIALALSFAPIGVFAQSQQIVDVNGLTSRFTNIGNTVVTILISLAVIWIIVNVVRYLIIGGDDAEKRKTAGSAILWGVVGLFVILSIWGLVNILRNSFKTENNAPVNDINKVINVKIPEIQ